MRLFLLILVSSSAVLSQHQSNRAPHPYEFVRTGFRRINGGSESQDRAGFPSHYLNRNTPAGLRNEDRSFVHHKKHLKGLGVPPYAVQMEPLVQYSQPDPFFNEQKQPVSEVKVQLATKNNLIKKSFESGEVKDGKEIRAENRIHIISSKSGRDAYDDADGDGSQNVEFSSYGQLYEGHYPEAPEPIIEIIIKESNQSLPAPPPLPAPPKKKKKEPVQVFYVKYKKDPTAYGEEKVIYEQPVPAVTPPTNDESSHEEEEEASEEHHHHHHEESTLPPPPSTTLKAIIRPESETFQGSGLHITFGATRDEDEHGQHHHNGNYEQQSAPQPAVVFPGTHPLTPRASPQPSQLTKRNPGPFHSQTPPPQQNFQPQNPSQPPQYNFPTPNQPPQQNFQPQTPTQPPFLPSSEFHRPNPPPTFQQTPQFPAQQFKQPPTPVPKPTFHHPQAQLPPRPIQYSTLPQHLQFQKPQVHIPPPNHQFAIPRLQPTHSQTYQQPQPNFNQKPVFQSNIRPQQPQQPQQYHTINHNNPPPNTYHTLPHEVTQNNFQIQHPQPANPQFRPFQNPPQPQQSISQPIPQQHRPPPPRVTPQDQLQHQQQVEQLNRLQQQQQLLQAQIQAQHEQTKHHFAPQPQQQHFAQTNQPYQSTTYAPEIVKSISPDHVSFPNNEHKNSFLPTQRTPFVQPSAQPSYNIYTSPSTARPEVTRTPVKYTQATTTEEVITEDPKIVEEEKKKKAEAHKKNVAALPSEVPDDLREQLLSSGILSNADIQILDYDKIGDIPIENLPPEALANFQAASAGSHPVPSIALPDSSNLDDEEDSLPAPSEVKPVAVKAGRKAADPMEMKVVRFNPDTNEGASVADQYMNQGAMQLEPVVLNDSKYNRYLPLKVSGAQFPVPDVPELRGRNVTSVVVLAPVDYEFLQRHDDEESRVGRRSATPVLEVQGVHFVAGDVLKTLVKTPTTENYRRWLDKENKTSADKQSVILLVVEPSSDGSKPDKEIFMYDIATQRVSKLKGELSSTFVEVAESNSQNQDLDEISDSPSAPGGDFTINTSKAQTIRSRRRGSSSS